MKRSGPIQRKTPLKAKPSSAEWQRAVNAKLSQGKGPRTLRARSPKRERDMVERRKLVKAMVAAQPRCQAQVLCHGDPVADVHERLSRARGGSILDPVQAHMMTVCRPCHDWITTHPRDAEARRLALPSWHQCPPCGPC